MNMIRALFRLLFTFGVFVSVCFAYAQQSAQQTEFAKMPNGKTSKVKLDYKFKTPTINDMSFYLVSLDKKVHKYLIKINDDTYTFLESAPKNTLGRQYALPKAKEIKIYSRSLVDGAEVFTEIGSLPTDGFSDFVMAAFQNEGKVTGKAIDLSIENMPLGTMNFVNLQPHTIGLIIDKKASKLPLFGHFRRALISKKPIVAKTVQVFNLRNPNKPEEFYNKEFIFDKQNRAIIFLMGLVKTKNDMDSSDLRQFVEMQNASPR